MVGFGTDPHHLLKVGAPGGEEHELLEGETISDMGSAILNVECLISNVIFSLSWRVSLPYQVYRGKSESIAPSSETRMKTPRIELISGSGLVDGATKLDEEGINSILLSDG